MFSILAPSRYLETQIRRYDPLRAFSFLVPLAAAERPLRLLAYYDKMVPAAEDNFLKSGPQTAQIYPCQYSDTST